ncbi:TIGR03619 family F420-dependent LLM class oxidoreductase [Couchioplanes caeruleus]|uniref:Oxidoreductase n=3 Tax=Couchioplanes caeruleus TaxID=56438 RepID=A0A1K0H3D8_9ACTN|nr:TIGR03619 family F420-dependent LLM class oxidoreductase [Couchioplanes caeruleus]OJF16219.1 Oxidoreductase [Couchioplanes caeruleus subsp. caeruleus]ROP28770.1 putative F420-dependent oxidoreductase [Couchioplanes caeruleus]
MDLGIDLLTSGPHACVEAIVRMAREAEVLGYAAVWTHERVLYPAGDVDQPPGPPRPLPMYYRKTYEPLDTLSFVAARSTGLRLGTSVLTAPLHHPILLARRLATLDQFSGGRVVVGLGQGWMRQEYEVAGVPFEQRGARLEDFVAALRAAWSPDPVSYDGPYYRIPPSHIDPKPHRRGGPRILVGAAAPAAIDRAARIADGFNPTSMSLERLSAAIERFRTSAARAGRDPGRLSIVVRAATPLTPSAMGLGRPFLGGSPDQVVEDLRQLAALAVDHVLFTNVRQPPLDEQLDLLERIKVAADRADLVPQVLDEQTIN